ncbi:MAG: putative tellurite resistance protein B-like protein [Planctomycetota bacterium]|jgi:uncharacterized tellurite resistance protein B-like protein
MLPTLLHSLTPTLLAIQAGGGGSFSGGGGSGGGDSGGGFAGWILYYLIQLVFRAPLIGIPLLLLFIFIVAKTGGVANNQRKGSAIARASQDIRSRQAKVSWLVLRARDPDFTPERLVERVSAAFYKAQAGWCRQDLGDVEPFLSDGVHERFTLQIAGQRTEGWRQDMVETTHGTISFLQAKSDAIYDSVTLRIPFRSLISKQSLKTGKRMPGTTLDKRNFVECWTFVRRASAKTRSTKGLMEGMCPNCGADLVMNRASVCKTCGCYAKSGEYDWVLTEITQESVWTPTSAATVPGFETCQESDPGLSLELLEDKASVAFWRMNAVDKIQSSDPLRRVATGRFCADYDERIQKRKGSTWQYKVDCAVGSIQTLGILPDGDQNIALVEVHWDGARVAVGKDGVHRIRKERHLQRTVLLFTRGAGEVSDLRTAFTTGSCTNCGAHDQGGIEATCPYCEAPRTEGKSAWLLDGAEIRTNPKVQGLLSRLPRLASREGSHTEHSPRTLLTWAISLSQADGKTTPKERAGLQKIAERNGVDSQTLDAMVRSIGEGVAPERPRDPKQAREWLGSLIHLALADGVLTGAEQKFLKQAAAHLKIQSREFKALLKAQRDALYLQAKQALKESRQRRRT